MSPEESSLSASPASRTWKLLPHAILAGLVLVELVLILIRNEGHFTYSLDDPYIHLRFGEQLWNGNFGFNTGEASAPSSSILWPFVLAPFSGFSFYSFLPFVLNLLAAFLTLRVYQDCLCELFSGLPASKRATVVALFTTLLIPASNLVGLIFTGLEHSWQVLAVAALVHGLYRESADGRIGKGLVLAMVLGPLIRYENLAFSLPAVLYLFARGHRRASGLLAASVLTPVIAYSLLLLSKDLPYLPSSVLAKATAAITSASPRSLLQTLFANLRDNQGTLLSFAILPFSLVMVSRSRSKAQRCFAAAIASAIVLHLIVGRFGWFHRYAVYVCTGTILALLCLFSEGIQRFADRESLAKLSVLAVLALAASSKGYVIALLRTPLACNNMYEQQYQMQRFAIEYYKKPIAVNDLGLVAFRNDNYVLDLYGLGSLSALRSRLAGKDSAWMQELAVQHDVGLAMIYRKWFTKLPPNWQLLGELELGAARITAFDSKVAFYALDPQTATDARALLREFIPGLPKGVRFTFNVD